MINFVCVLGRPAEFTVYTHKAGGAGKVEVDCKDQDGNPVEVKLKDNRDGTYSVSYLPIKPGTYTVTIKFAGANIQKSPYEVQHNVVVVLIRDAGGYF